MRPPKLSVLLCSYNRAKNVRHCLAALAQQTLPKSDYEVICVNDGSSDNTGKFMQEALQSLPGTYIEHERNLALAAGRNSAIRASSGEYVVFINDDTYPEPTFLEEHLRTHRAYRNQNLAVLGFLPFIPKLRNRIFSRILMEHDLYFNFAKLIEGNTYPFWYFVTGNLSVPRKWFTQNDVWFDETFLRYGFEDIECGYRLWRRGLRVIYNPRAICQHEHRITIDNYLSRAIDNATNILQFVAKHPDQYIALTMLNIPRLTLEDMQRWKEQTNNMESSVVPATDQIRALEDQEIPPGTLTTEAETQLLTSVAQATRSLGDYMKFKTFLEVLEEYPTLREHLLSNQWLENAQRIYRKAEINNKPFLMHEANCA